MKVGIVIPACDEQETVGEIGRRIGREYCNPEVVAFLPQDMMRQIA